MMSSFVQILRADLATVHVAALGLYFFVFFMFFEEVYRPCD